MNSVGTQDSTWLGPCANAWILEPFGRISVPAEPTAFMLTFDHVPSKFLQFRSQSGSSDIMSEMRACLMSLS